MRYYTIQEDSILIADNESSLTRFYNNVYELPEDYEVGKYIIGEEEREIEVVDPETGETHIEIVKVKVLVLNPNWEQEQAEKEAQRIAQLHLTRGDVFRGLLMARQVTRAQIRALIEQMPDETPEQQIAKEYALIDFDESLDFYRGVALIETLGLQLGISSEAMTQFFETNDWHYLIPDTREVQ